MLDARTAQDGDVGDGHLERAKRAERRWLVLRRGRAAVCASSGAMRNREPLANPRPRRHRMRRSRLCLCLCLWRWLADWSHLVTLAGLAFTLWGTVLAAHSAAEDYRKHRGHSPLPRYDKAKA